MHSPPRTPPALKRTVSGASHSSYASAATASSRSSSRLLFGEIPLTPATSIDGRSTRSNSSIGSICNLVLSTSSAFLRFWLNDTCRDTLLAHLEQEDFSNFRLVCHDFATRAAPVQFESIVATFKPSTFSKPARIEALSRIGRHVKTFTFHMPHSPETLLPPIIDPVTGDEKPFIYEPQMQTPLPSPGRDKIPKYGTEEMTNLLIQQYPPLFHAATNVPAFVAAFSSLINLTHLKISCPGSDQTPGHRRSAVDYALISLRIAVERAPVYSLTSLSLHPIHPGGLLHLQPIQGPGSTPSSAKRWSQVRSLSICMEALPQSPKARLHSLEQLRTLHAYLRALSHNLTSLFFRWKGARGPSPLSLDKEPCMQPFEKVNHVNSSSLNLTHPSQRSQYQNRHQSSSSLSSQPAPTPLHFPRLTHMTLENALTTPPQIASFIHTHRRSLRDFAFEDVKLSSGDWDQALAPLTRIAGGCDRWRREQLEVWDVPVMLSPVGLPAGDRERVMGPLLEEVEGAIEGFARGAGESPARHTSHTSHSLSKWLGKPRSSIQPISRAAKDAKKESFWGGGSEGIKKFLKGGALRWK